MATASDLIMATYRRFVDELPALEKLALSIRVELRGRGDVQVFRVQSPGPEITKMDPDDARLEISMPRATLNEHAEEGTIDDWNGALEHGDIKVGGDPAVVKLLGTVIGKHQARTHFKRVR